jgi:translocator protein
MAVGVVWCSVAVELDVDTDLFWNAESQMGKHELNNDAFIGIQVFYFFFFQGFIEITFLTISVWACGFIFGRINKIAGYLFIPYIIWVSFAMCLNFAIWRMNLDWEPHQAEIGST